MNKPQKNRLEWAVFVIGLVLVVAVLAYLAYDGLTMGDAPPSIEVRLGSPEPRPHNFIVPVIVINHGDMTAEGVHVEVVIEAEGGDERERGEFQVAFLPRHARREGWVAFQTDPRPFQLKARVLGYEDP